MAKGGTKLLPSDCIHREPGDRTIAAGKTESDYCGNVGMGMGRLSATSMTMGDLVTNFLPLLLNRTVVDKTGITGEFRIQLAFTADASNHSLGMVGPPPVDGAAAADVGPDIFTAMQEQLGLKLESAKGPVQVLVIDHAEKPDAN